ncbi:MAG: exodeoxyribonuclease VII small subunit [Gammaproteobacteria bacterium]|nr:MAG: exodeoxyribonuclease VII small subunit [Gammaproteobacteria bacterium]
MNKQANEASFEANLRALEDVVTQLERGDLPLEEALRQFERGVQLTRQCRKALETAQLKVEKLEQLIKESPLEQFNADE